LDGRLLVSGSGDKTARVWDVDSALATASGSGSTGGTETINDVAKAIVLTITDNASDKIKDVDVDGDAVYPPKDDSDRGGSGDRMDVDSEKTIATNEDADATDEHLIPDAGITSIAVSPDGQYVAAGSLDSVIRLWDLRQPSSSSSSGERQSPVLIERLKGHKDSVYSVSFTKDGRFLVSASLDQGVRVWNVGHLDIVPALGSSTSSLSPSRLVGNRQPGKGNERTVARGGKGKQKSRCVTQFVGHRDYVLSVAVSFDGRWVVSGSKDRGVMWWDLGLSSTEDSSSGESSTSGNTSAVTKRDREAVCMLQGHKNSVISIDLSPVGNMLATGSGDWQARICEYSFFLIEPACVLT
jgi:glucose repression regulatory protein TUP1